MYGLDRDTLIINKQGQLAIFDDNRNIDGYLILHIQASGTGILKVDNQSIKLVPEIKTYDISIPFKSIVMISAEDQNARILSYSTEKH